jgi:2-octaprenyl-6-methoxyphenol hydroxylase
VNGELAGTQDIDVMASERTHEQVDVLIGGGGFAGLALAIALRQGLGPSFSVTVADPALGSAAPDGRASAIVAAARRLFETIGVWHQVEAQPYSRHGRHRQPPAGCRCGRLSSPSKGDLEPGEPFAHMVENGPLLAALTEKAKQEGVVLRPSAVADISPLAQNAAEHSSRGASPVVDGVLADGTAISARLVVAADGAHSSIRRRAGIASHGWNYDQSAIVTTVAHERDHNGRAEEHFLPAGPVRDLAAETRRRHRPPLVDRLDRAGARSGADCCASRR